MPIAIVIGAAPVVMFTGAQKLAADLDEIGVAGALAGRSVPITKCSIDLDVPADFEIVIEGLIDTGSSSPKHRSARATAMWRSKPSTCRCR